MITDFYWQEFARQENLTEKQPNQFKIYSDLLLAWNERINLTAITDIQEVLAYHFQDSMSLAKMMNLSAIQSLADIGSGAGFPSIPLKILYPHLDIHIIEVNSKRIIFLRELVQALDLESIEIHAMDWRTFLRKTSFEIEVFCARASLSVLELLYAFKPSCLYNKALIVYWASQQWVQSIKEDSYIDKEYHYTVGRKERKLVVFSAVQCII